MLLQLFELGLHGAHHKILFAHADTLINIEGQCNRFENNRKHDDSETDRPDAFDDRLRKFSEPVQPDFVSVFEDVDPDRIEQRL